MITPSSARALPKAKFLPTEEDGITAILARLDNVIETEFDGLGVYLGVPADQANARMISEVARRTECNGWNVALGFEFMKMPSSLIGGKPELRLASYTLTVAVDKIAAEILKVRKETAQ